MHSGVIVFDFDDVLVDLSSLVYHNIRENWRIYSRWFNDFGELSKKELQSRKIFNIPEWLINVEKFKNLTPGQYSSLQLIIFNTLLETFFKHDIYAYAEPTELAKKTLLNPKYIDDKSIKKVYIISRNVCEQQDISKRKFISKFFNHPKIEYISVDRNSNKGKTLKERNIDFNLFIDDEIPNIRNVIEEYHDTLDRKEFLIPEYGYNKLPPELEIIAREKGAVVTYYEEK